MQECNWEFFKQFITDTELPWLYVNGNDESYTAFVSSSNITIKCYIAPNSIEKTEFEASYKTFGNKSTLSQPSPFAKPSFRTKMDAILNWVTCSSDSVTDLDFTLMNERYVTGGEIIFKNAKEGDYITACVYDGFNGGVIPEAYRASLCEAWPIVATYVEKRYLVPTTVDGYGILALDTYPLNAKISQYLQLRVTYHSTSEVGDRRVTVNYNLTQKL